MKIMWAVLGIDSASMMLNIFFQHAFTTRQITLSDGSVYFLFDQYLAYDIHLCIVYLLLLFTIICLIYQTVKAPAMFRRKYLVIMAILMGVIVVDGFYLFKFGDIDISMIGFGIAGVLIYYYALLYVPKMLENRTLSLVVKDMNDAVFLFDAEGKCILANDSALEMFPMKNGLADAEERFIEWTREGNIKDCDGKQWQWKYTQDGKEQSYRAVFHCLFDKKQQYLGGFLTIHNSTEEVEALNYERYRATHDSLTGLYNKEHFYECARAVLQENQEDTFLMVCSDIKNFKLINDVFGTKAGDEILIDIGNKIIERTKPGEVYGRLENDRFALLMKKSDYNEHVFVDGPQEVRMDEDISYPINIYVGVYEITDRTMSISAMCDRSFMAINTIKGSLRQKVAYYDDNLRQGALKEQELTGELPKAMARGDIQIYLQPQITVDGKVPGAEALVRWIHPKKGMLMPGEFIEVFERNGMIVKLDQYIWELACKQLKKWKDEGHEDKYISVNISPTDFHFIDIYEVFTELVQKYEVAPQNLKLEITETAVIMDLEKQLELIHKLRTVGFIVEMDDFGSGYSSLNMLKDIRVDVLKFDMKFLRSSDDEERSRKILKSMVALSKDLEMPSITEGVETLEQVEFLTEIGCGMFQGYYFAKPMAIQMFEEKYM